MVVTSIHSPTIFLLKTQFVPDIVLDKENTNGEQKHKQSPTLWNSQIGGELIMQIYVC